MNPIYVIKIQESLIEYVINNISPHIYDGIKSIYDTAKQYSKCEEVLKVFQEFIQNIPLWNNVILESEVKRILIECKLEKDVMINILRNIIKYTIAIYSFNENSLIQYENEIDFNLFIWNIYKTIGKEVYLNPFLLYDNVSPTDRNTSIVYLKSLINKTIHNIILDLIPIKNITEYLQQLDINKKLQYNNDNKFTKILSEDQSDFNIKNIIDREIEKLKNISDDKLDIPPQNLIQPIVPPIIPIIPPLNKADEKSAEHIINNDKIEKLSSTDNIKQIEKELQDNINKDKLLGGEQQLEHNTDLIKKLDNDRNEVNIKPQLIETDSDSTSSNYVNNENNINVYSNAKTSSNSGVFVTKKPISKYKHVSL
jgi:hypothetical protein